MDAAEQLAKENRNLAQKIADWLRKWVRSIRAAMQDLKAERPESRAMLQYAQELQEIWDNALVAAARNNRGVGESYERNSIRNVEGVGGKDYGVGVYLDSVLLKNLTDTERIQMVKERIRELGGKHFAAYNMSDEKVDIQIAEPGARFVNKSGKSVPVNNDLATKNRKSAIKQETVVLADEMISAARHKKSSPARYSHGWLDNNGQNDWEEWKTYVQDRGGSVREATLHIATAKTGQKYLYDIDPIKMVEQSGKSDTSTTNYSILQSAENSQEENSGGTKYSKRDKYLVPTKKAQYSVHEEFASEIDQWNHAGRPEGERFTLGSTGPVLQGLGAIESDIYMEGDKISTILREHPEMTMAEIKKIPQILEDPALVLKSKTRGNSIVVLGTYRAQNGKPILAAMDLRPMDKGFIITDMQKVSSAYTKTDSKNMTAEEKGRQFLKTSKVLFLDKKRAATVLRPMGIQAPIDLLRNGYIGSISYGDGFVNIKGLPFSSIVKISDNGEVSGGTKYSKRDKYWHPKLTGDEWTLLNRRMDAEIESDENFVDERTKWVYADEKGVQVFALYGVGDGTEATPLYAVGGKRAIQAENRLRERMEEFEHYDGDGESVDTLLESIRGERGRSYGNIVARGNGETAKRDAELHGGQQERDPGESSGRSSADQRGVTKQNQQREYRLSGGTNACNEPYSSLRADPQMR